MYCKCQSGSTQDLIFMFLRQRKNIMRNGKDWNDDHVVVTHEEVIQLMQRVKIGKYWSRQNFC